MSSADKPTSSTLSMATLTAQALGLVDSQTRSVVLPIYPATTYLRDTDNQYCSGHVYSRDDNPTYKPVESLLCKLEKGEDALLFGSGMAAAVAVFQALRPGDHVIAPKVMYWSLRNWLLGFATDWGLQVSLVDCTDTEAVARAIIPNKTRLVWLETPANPMWTLSDIGAISQLCKPHQITLAVDSTCATPVLSQPLTLGADIVMHSATKYLNGHSDVIAGALITAQDTPLWQRIRTIRRAGGAVMSPFDASQLSRGMRTLVIRVQQACRNAVAIAEALQQHPLVTHVHYPGLLSGEALALAQRQMPGGYGAMLSVQVRGGEAAAIATAAHTKLWKRATSLGGVESLIEHRASIEGQGTPVPNDLLRLSTGIEDADELLADFIQALEAGHDV
ncbi:trans-sulfuration enzyme family protein [Aliidiomarina maris]|uniref:Cystathionine gamma-synthase n=2 Tax=Aliidiomarina maris TaxID=531312 RepID=A0A327WV38_9GAMM|nr:PLP-dependent aspartate aminotransferase family protein [Aliidiomarina maris]MCL5049489.1 PLP-dependent aspartate aminotransferase family protein [Bacillota bacterium]RAJ96885.1 cystathionine gamma-synthase [Aliidiomarina maris]